MVSRFEHVQPQWCLPYKVVNVCAQWLRLQALGRSGKNYGKEYGMVRGRKSPPDRIGEAKALLLAGNAIMHVAQVTGLSRSVVGRIALELRDELRQNLRNLREQQYDVLAASLRAQIEQVKVMGDEQWLRQLDPREFALLFGINSDKTYRMLVTLSASDGEDAACGESGHER